MVDGQSTRTTLRDVRLSPGNIWRVGLVILAIIGLALFIKFLLEDGGGVLFVILMAWFAALAMAPLVERMSRVMKRGLATIIVMVAFLLFAAFFLFAFGNLLVDQLVQLAMEVPGVIDQALGWANERLGTAYEFNDILAMFDVETADLALYAGEVVIGVLGFVTSLVGSVFSIFTFGLFLFYFSAQLPQFQRWVAGLFPERVQEFVMNVWRLTSEKTGGYIGARVILATINSATTAIVFLIIDMPYWLPLALWTGIVAQFVPTIGTYISIALPVLVGLLSENPYVGLLALAWAVIYQQIENLTIEPRISAKAVNVNPAVAFGSVLLGASLFGVAGAFLAIPVTAMLLSLLDIYGKRYELIAELRGHDDTKVPQLEQSGDATTADGS
ncbi:AI-2E family transporter [Candidatus Nanopelagicales bacterium]|nr:AI-2E family transporter [Candidatus Nanopelagicales bacterium]